MSVGLRSMVARLFSYQDGGNGGLMQSQYVPIRTPTGGELWWCRAVEGIGTEETLGEKARQVQQIVVAFSSEVTVDPRGLMRISGVNYRITGTTQKPLAHEVHVSGVWAQEDTFEVTS